VPHCDDLRKVDFGGDVLEEGVVWA
jgi:hypothetical protein